MVSDALVVEEVDDATLEKDKERARDMGTIRVEVFRAIKTQTVVSRAYPAGNQDRNSGKEGLEDKEQEDERLAIAEKALKGRAISHKTR